MSASLSRRTVLLSAALAASSAALACVDTPPLSLEVDRVSIPADGVAQVHLTAHVRDPVAGAVVQWTADGGALSSSSVAVVDQTADVVLTAPIERDLGRHATRTLSVTAAVVLSATDRRDAAVTIEATPPTTGAPLLFLDADPPAAEAGSGGAVTLHILARRVATGAALDVTSADAEVTTGHVTLSAAGEATASIAVPATPIDARVTVRDPASGVSVDVVVRFVAAGSPLYDLTGTFVQIGPARVKLASGALTPNPQCALAPSIVLARFTQTALAVDARYTTCDIAFPPVTSIVGTVTDRATDAFYAAIPVVQQSFTLAGAALGTLYAPPPSVVVVGAALDDPAHDALPTDAADPRIVDADADGQPGVTIENSLGGNQNVVFRNIGTTRGNIVSSNRIVGATPGDLLATTETQVLGIGGAFLPDTTALGSVVEVVRIDGAFGSLDADANHDGVVTCAEAVDVAGSVRELEPPETPFDCGADK